MNSYQPKISSLMQKLKALQLHQKFPADWLRLDKVTMKERLMLIAELRKRAGSVLLLLKIKGNACRSYITIRINTSLRST